MVPPSPVVVGGSYVHWKNTSKSKVQIFNRFSSGSNDFPCAFVTGRNSRNCEIFINSLPLALATSIAPNLSTKSKKEVRPAKVSSSAREELSEPGRKENNKNYNFNKYVV